MLAGSEEIADADPVAGCTALTTCAGLVRVGFLVWLDDDEPVVASEFELEGFARRAPEEALDVQVVFRVG